MGFVPRSLPTALRSLLALAVATFLLGGALGAWVDAFDRRQVPQDAWAMLGALPFDWDGLLHDDWRWTRGVLVWAAVCWLATRARAGLRTRWLPATAGVLIVVVRSVGGLVPGVPEMWFAMVWPGPERPYRWDATGSDVWVSVAHPAWGYPVLVAAALVAASLLGTRAGALPDDRASRHVTPAPRTGLPVAAVIVGLPAVGGTAAAVAAYAAMARDHLGASPWSGLAEIVVPLVSAAVAAALLSGTGPLGAAVTVLVPLLLVWTPVATWFGGGDDLLLAQAAGIAVVCAVAALWRPCVTWAAKVGEPVTVPAEPSPVPSPRRPPGSR